MALVAAACTPQTDGPPDQLAILSAGDVITIDRDGSNAVIVAADPSGDFFQPIWSPDRSLLAFALNGEQPAIGVARLGDSELFSAATDSFPFYFMWSSRNELGLLRNGGEGLNLETVSPIGGELGPLEVVATGQPLYFSWSPDGAEIVAHIGIDELVISDLNEASPVPVSAGTFQAPAWTTNGIMALAEMADRQVLARIGKDGSVDAIAAAAGTTTFVPNRDGSLIALQTVAAQEQFRSAALQTLPRAPANQLVVIDAATGMVTTITSSPVLAYFWSPAADQLLVLDIVEGPAARWRVWADGAMEELVRFEPDPTFVGQFLPFFDQYAQSMSLWSPSGDAIAFPGTIAGRAGIWVQELGGEPAWIHDGSWVTWAP